MSFSEFTSSPFTYSLPKLDYKNACNPEKKKLSEYLKKSKDRVHFQNGDFFVMQVSNETIGNFIGKRGNKISELRQKYSSKILVSNENGKRLVYISQSHDKLKIIGHLMYALL